MSAYYSAVRTQTCLFPAHFSGAWVWFAVAVLSAQPSVSMTAGRRSAALEAMTASAPPASAAAAPTAAAAAGGVAAAGSLTSGAAAAAAAGAEAASGSAHATKSATGTGGASGMQRMLVGGMYAV